MKREQFTFYRSYYEALKPLSKRDQTAVLMAIAGYALDETEPSLSGVPLSVFTLIRPTLDSGRNKAKNRCKKTEPNAEQNDNKSEQKRKEKESEKEREVEKEGEGENECSPPVSPLDDTGFSEPLQAALLSWVRYKREKRQDYKPEGLKSLIGEIRHNADQYGDDAVIALINRCMAANWQGIIFERLEKSRRDQKAAEPWHYDPGSLEGSL